MSVAPESGLNRIMIYGPKGDGTYVVEFKTADGEALAISVPVGETRVLVCPTGCPRMREKRTPNSGVPLTCEQLSQQISNATCNAGTKVLHSAFGTE